MTHFKENSCRIGISRLLLGNRTDELHVETAATNILNKLLCTTKSRCSFVLGFSDAENFIILKEKLPNMLQDVVPSVQKNPAA